MCAVCRQRLGSFCSQSPVPASPPRGIHAWGGALPQGFKHDPARSAELPLGPLCPPSACQPGFAAWVSPPPRWNKAARCHLCLPVSHFSPPTLAAGLLPTCSIQKIGQNQVGAGCQYRCWVPPCATGHSRTMPGVPAVRLHHYFGGVRPACCSQTVFARLPASGHPYPAAQGCLRLQKAKRAAAALGSGSDPAGLPVPRSGAPWVSFQKKKNTTLLAVDMISERSNRWGRSCLGWARGHLGLCVMPGRDANNPKAPVGGRRMGCAAGPLLIP